jgi:hypothetical protein
MDRKKSAPDSDRFARVGALVCLLSVMLGPAGIFPGLLAGGAVWEGSHEVHIGWDDGTCHLVLSHERGQAGRRDYDPRHNPGSGIHRHGLAAGLLCFLANPNDREPDHAADFSIGPAGEEILKRSGRPMQPAPDPGMALVKSEHPPRTVGLPSVLSLLNHGPPPFAGSAHLMGSTVLLL